MCLEDIDMAHLNTVPIEPRSPWLAISYGCCASRKDSGEEDRDGLNANKDTEMRICYNQPQSVPYPRAVPVPPSPRPPTIHSVKRHVSQWVISTQDFASRASSRASIHTVQRPWTSHSKQRPSIGRPTDFRRFDGLDLDDPEGIQRMIDDAPPPFRRGRRSFQPLELSIYLPDGRLSPLPDFTHPDWEVKPVDLMPPAQAHIRDRDSRTNSISSNPSSSAYLISRKPVGSGIGSRRSSVQSQSSAVSVHSRLSRPVSGTLPFLLEDPACVSRPESLMGSPHMQRSTTHRSLNSPRRLVSRLPSPSRARSNTDSALIASRRGSVRRAKTEVDDAIRELNTIVEERRADAYRSRSQSPAMFSRPPPSPSHHVPLIAPSLRMHVRSETLSDIGSAFSVPLASKPLPTPPSIPEEEPRPGLSRTTTKLSLAPTLVPSLREPGGPLSSNPITPPTPTVPTPTSSIGRLGAWLKRSLPSTPNSPSFFKSSIPKDQLTPLSPPPAFYSCMEDSSKVQQRGSRPSTAGSRKSARSHQRQDSNETATVTLFSESPTARGSYPSTPSLSPHTSRTSSPEPTLNSNPHTPPMPNSHSASPKRVSILKGESPLRGTGKTRRIPAPLVLAKDKEYGIESPMHSARSTMSSRSAKSVRSIGGGLRPPESPNYNILRGMEISVPPVDLRGSRGSLGPSVSPVGIAF